MEKEKQTNQETQESALQSVKSFVLIILIGVLCFYALINNTRSTGQVLPMIFGKGCAVVMTGSMEPTIPIDSLIFVDEEDGYSEGDIVVIQNYYSLVVHRIVKIDGDQVITKGDANNTEDEPSDISAIRGKVVWHIPYVGYAITFMKTPLGSLILICVVFLLFMSFNRKTEDDEETDTEGE